MDTTAHDLRLLSIGYFIQGGIVIFSGLLFLCYLALIGAVFASVQNGAQVDPQKQIPAHLLYAIGVVVIAMALVTLLVGACMLYSGVALRKRKNRTLILVMAALNCLAIPYGTVLGIFTFLVLQRTIAKEMFGQMAAAPESPQALS
jgi:heme/copper-type cytochrome/quinol oxidase subunit 2